MREILLVGGTGEASGRVQGSFLRNWLDPFLRRDDKVVGIPYPASIGIANATPDPLDVRESALQSRKIGVRNLAEYVKNTPFVPFLVGYSLGAWVVSDFLEEMAAGKHPGLEIAGAILVASPRNGNDTGYGYGIAGKHKPYPAIPIMEVNNWNDGICCCPKGSALRVLPLMGEVFTLAADDPDVREAWVNFIARAFAEVKVLPTVHDAMLLRNYVKGTAHGKDYFKPGLRNAARRVLR